MSGRGDLLVPEGWAPRRGSTVAVLASRDEPVPPSGAWRVVEHAPEAGTWWLLPHDDAARAWRDKHRTRIVTGCLAMSGRRLVPPGHKPRPAETRKR